MARTSSHRCRPNRPCHTNQKVAAWMSAYYGQGGGGAEVDSQGRRAFLVIGDSIARGTNGAPSTGPGPTPTAGTSYYYVRTGNEIQEIGANDLENAFYPPNDGSPWPKFAIDYNTAGGKAVIIPTAKGSSNFANQGTADDCWDPTVVGSLYGDAVTDANACLNLMGIGKLTAIFIILGINDARGVVDLADIDTSIGNLLTQLQDDFPNTDIVMCQIGKSELVRVDARIAQIRKYIRTYAEGITRLNLLATMLSADAANQISDDDIHLRQTGNNNCGAMFARWMANSTLSKWARSIVSSRYDDLTSARKTLIDNFITQNLTDYLDHDFLYVFKSNSIQGNFYIDWSFMCGPLNVDGALIADDSYDMNGTTAHFKTGYNSNLLNFKATQTDLFIAAKIKTATTAAGTPAALIAATLSTINSLAIQQTSGSTLIYRINDQTNNTFTDTKFANDTEYLAGRNGGNKFLYKNGAQVATEAVASVANLDVEVYLSAINSSDMPLLFEEGEYHYCRGGKFTTVDQAAFYAALETLIDNW